MDVLPTVWFIAISTLWIGYLLLEGFDLGVGMHMLVTAKNPLQRRIMLNTIGPVWDGNEVWLLTAGAATFAAFPLWYASLFSALYIPLTVVLLGLIFRAVAIEYRGKGSSDRWTTSWDIALGLGSFVSAFGVGALLALTTTGLPIDANGDRVGGPFAWLNGYAILGGLAVVGFCFAHAAVFLGLKTEGPVRIAAGRFFVMWAPAALLPLIAWVLAVEFKSGSPVSWSLVGGAVVALTFSWWNAWKKREGRAFAGLAVFLIAGAGSLFTAIYPILLPSTIDASNNLTISNASSGSYTLGVMTWVTAFGLPLVLVYQGWTYWVFRQRIGERHMPAAHPVKPLAPR
jgi:cytochrome d ubiquinol oxidase subunit II